MTFWLIAGAMTALAVGLLLPPLLRRPAQSTPRQAYDLSVYRDQLTEVERDVQRGVLTPDQAAAARTEIERRLLAAAGDEPAAKRPARPAGKPWPLAAGLAAGLPLAALGLYILLGAPGVPGLPLAERERPGAVAQDAVQLVERLAQQMAEAPEDPGGWRLLARAYSELGAFDEAGRALHQAIARGDESADTRAALGEALTAANGGRVVPDARRAFAAALERDPANPRARYYGGLAYAQDDRPDEALRVWQTLARESPADAPWQPFLTEQIARTLATLDGTSEGSNAPGPSAEDMAAAGEMTSEQRAAFIHSMVERLATRLEAEPNDLNGWLRLTRAYTVLGEREPAAAALARASALAKDLPPDAPQHSAIGRAREALAETR